MRAVIAAGLALGIALPAAAQEPCNFDGALAEGLIATQFDEITEEVKRDAQAQRNLAAAMPNVKRIFVSRDRVFTALVGWSDLGEDFSRLSREEVEERLREAAELGLRQSANRGIDFKYRIDAQGSPVTSYFTVDYADQDRNFRDVAIDVVATRTCLFSAKFGGPADDAPSAWDFFAQEFERLRAAVERDGPVAYAAEGAGAASGMWLWLALGAGLATAGGAAWLIRRRQA